MSFAAASDCRTIAIYEYTPYLVLDSILQILHRIALCHAVRGGSCSCPLALLLKLLDSPFGAAEFLDSDVAHNAAARRPSPMKPGRPRAASSGRRAPASSGG